MSNDDHQLYLELDEPVNSIQAKPKRTVSKPAEGICTRCRCRPHRPGRVNCQECADYIRDYNVKRKERLIAQGLCRDCTVRLARPGHVTCLECATAPRYSGEAGRIRNERAARKREEAGRTGTVTARNKTDGRLMFEESPIERDILNEIDELELPKLRGTSDDPRSGFY